MVYVNRKAVCYIARNAADTKLGVRCANARDTSTAVEVRLLSWITLAAPGLGAVHDIWLRALGACAGDGVVGAHARLALGGLRIRAGAREARCAGRPSAVDHLITRQTADTELAVVGSGAVLTAGAIGVWLRTRSARHTAGGLGVGRVCDAACVAHLAHRCACHRVRPRWAWHTRIDVEGHWSIFASGTWDTKIALVVTKCT